MLVPAARVLVVLAIVLAVRAASAQSGPPTAEQLVEKVQKYYANTQHLSATFRHTVYNRLFGTSTDVDGTLWVSKPAQFRWEYLAKGTNGFRAHTKIVASDGKTLWVVEHAKKQILKQDVNDSALPAIVSFFTDGNLAKDFDVTIATATPLGGKKSTVIKLTPKQTSPQYKHLYFAVDPADGHVSAVKLDDEHTFDFFAPDTKSAVQPDQFQIDPVNFPGYKVIVM